MIEMLTVVAMLVIVLGLMVSLARDVRNRSADRLTKDLLRRLDNLVDQYRARHLRTLPPGEHPSYPAVQPLIDSTDLRESRLHENALLNNKQLIRTLRAESDLSANAFSDLSIANYNEVTLLDAWGNPIVFMPHQHPDVGMAAEDRSFFFSAGPDRKYLTRQDNFYSYETAPSP